MGLTFFPLLQKEILNILKKKKKITRVSNLPSHILCEISKIFHVMIQKLDAADRLYVSERKNEESFMEAESKCSERPHKFKVAFSNFFIHTFDFRQSEGKTERIMRRWRSLNGIFS